MNEYVIFMDLESFRYLEAVRNIYYYFQRKDQIPYCILYQYFRIIKSGKNSILRTQSYEIKSI